jgi:ABC-type branched-subunit amino acid transport system substrate-binding protein
MSIDSTRRRALRSAAWAGAALAAGLPPGAARAQKKYDTGASDTEIVIGNTAPYSGPASNYGMMAKVDAAYFRKLNEEGGVNGRKINFISLDDGYSPPKAVEMTRRLVEADGVLLMFHQLGTAANAAIQKYLNTKGIPHLFMSTGASRFIDPKGAPFSMAVIAGYHTEGRVYGEHVRRTQPDAKIGVLFQNDDYGRDYLRGFKEGLGEKVANIVSEASYEATDPTVDSQIVTLKGAGATLLLIAALAKPASQALRKAWDIGWRPTIYVIGTSSGISSTLQPAGLEKTVGVITATNSKDPRDPRWDNDPGMKAYHAFMKKYLPEADALDRINVAAYTAAQLLVQVLRQCGDELTRENVMRQAANLKDVALPLMLPGIRITTSPTDYRVIRSMQIERFDGQKYEPLGGLISL